MGEPTTFIINYELKSSAQYSWFIMHMIDDYQLEDAIKQEERVLIEFDLLISELFISYEDD